METDYKPSKKEMLRDIRWCFYFAAFFFACGFFVAKVAHAETGCPEAYWNEDTKHYDTKYSQAACCRQWEKLCFHEAPHANQAEWCANYSECMSRK